MTLTTSETTHGPSGSWPHTGPSTSRSSPVSGGPAQTFATATGLVIYADFPSADGVPLPPGYADIDEIVASRETDAVRRTHLERARQVLATQMYAEEPVTLAVLRLRKGWSQRQLAEKAGISQAHIARIEAGREDVRLGALRRVASGLTHWAASVSVP